MLSSLCPLRSLRNIEWVLKGPESVPACYERHASEPISASRKGVAEGGQDKTTQKESHAAGVSEGRTVRDC